MALAVVGVFTNNQSTSVGDNTIDAFGENTNKGGKINYTYDVAGNRISKTVTPYSGGTAGTPVTTWYVRYASGNVMGIYTGGGGSTAVNSGDVTLAEIPLYGSGRLGELKPNTDVQNITATTVTLSNGTVVTTSSFTRGQKVYELSNHLGNVLATVSDRKAGVDANGNGIIDATEAYNADVVSAQDYYPFGMLEPGRQYNAGSQYRYGFNGQENSDEIGANTTTAEYWEYDARIGRRWNVDPKGNPYESLYSVLSNNPIANVDPDGRFSINNHAEFTNTVLKKLGYGDIIRSYISAYASMFADHPPKWVRLIEGERNLPYVEKSWAKTGKSQDPDVEHNTWHSMKAPGETISDEAAMARGQAFGWGKIIDASSEISKAGGLGAYFDIKHYEDNGEEWGGLKDGVDLTGIEDLGQGIHALQDAIAHKGASLHGGNAKKHSLWNDMYPSKDEIAKADDVTTSAMLSMEVLTGNYKNITNGMTINLTGTTIDQYNIVKAAFQKAVNASGGKIKTIYFKGKPVEKKTN